MSDIWGEANKTVLTSRLRAYEQKYFASVAPVVGLELARIMGPAGLLPTRIIQINPVVASFSKLCGVLLLHELIHHKLMLEDGDPDEEEGARFQAEVARLWEVGAYRNLL